MESKKINQLATELAPDLSDITIIGDPTTGVSKKITLSQMASLFTGTVEEYANFAAFPLVGVADTIYVAKDTNVIYRWDSTAYVVLSPNVIASLVFNDANGFDGTIALVGSVATLTITTALTTGSVGFIGAAGALLEDNTNFFWNNTTKRLGIGTNAPGAKLDVHGTGTIVQINGTTTNNAFISFQNAGVNKWTIGNVQADHRFRIYSEANSAELVSVLQTGEFGIGISNPTTKFHIDGGASALIANLDANVSIAKSVSYRSDNSARINLEVSGTESGSNVGADFFLRTFTDAGSLLETPFTIVRSTGVTTIKSLTLTNALAATSGGTGQSSYAIGDILYASTTTALSKLADVATGNALISGGVGVAPSWGKIALTTHVSGILPVANGGTGSATQNFVDLTSIQTAAGAKTFSAITNITNATASTSTTTGGLVVTGGVGIGGDLFGTSATFTTSAVNVLNIAPTTGTAQSRIKITNTSGDIYIGIASSTGTSAISGTTAYSGYIATADNSTDFFIGTGGAQRLIITSTGNIGIGSATADSKLQITSTNQGNSVTYGSIFNVTTATAINDRLNINFSQNGNIDRARAAIGAVAELANGLASSLAFYTRTAVDGSALATTDERMRINSAGNIGIGVIPYNWGRADFIPVDVGDLAALATYNTAYSILTNNIYYNGGWKYKLTGYGNAILLRQDDGAIAFATFGTGTAGAAATFSERMRINSNGNTSIGLASDGGAKLYVGGTFTAAVTLASGYAHTLANQSTTSGASCLFLDAYASSSSSFGLSVRTNDGNSYPFRVRCDGWLISATTYNNTSGVSANVGIDSAGNIFRATSSIKYKKDIKPYDKGLDTILLMNPIYYKSKSDFDGDKQFAGFIAEEIHELGLNEFVQYNDENNEPEGLNYGNITAILVKAIQELKSEIDLLKVK